MCLLDPTAACLEACVAYVSFRTVATSAVGICGGGGQTPPRDFRRNRSKTFSFLGFLLKVAVRKFDVAQKKVPNHYPVQKIVI